MGSSEQLAENLKMKLIDAYKAGESYKKCQCCCSVFAVKGNCGCEGILWNSQTELLVCLTEGHINIPILQQITCWKVKLTQEWWFTVLQP